MVQEELYHRFADALNGSKKILITSHENPDGDALGSMLVMYDYLVSLGKSCKMYGNGFLPPQFSFLSFVEKISQDRDSLLIEEFDLILMLDCGSARRTRIDDLIFGSDAVKINIDHHASNENFGDINIVDERAVSTTEILYSFFKTQRVTLSKSMATAILTGILTDSGNFAYAATSPDTFNIASEMLVHGANVRNILAATGRNKNLPILQIWGLALNRLHYNKEYEIAYTVLTQADMKSFGVDAFELDGLSSFLNTMKNAKVVMVLYELADGRIKGSLRTNRHDVDVAKLAQVYGGGGHQKAAGFEVTGKLEKVGERWKIT
ncbi:MAG: bifunctional oligoribonuclease/PAP phosphatase NrnA [bacterium]|nr:bifunctional oligoribonuclease/PAP phosphatase NrnA [bacterium]